MKNIYQEDELTGEKSLEIIHQMINKAKANITDNGVGWLLWGTMIFLASLCTFFLIEFDQPNVFIGWNIFGIISMLLLLFGLFKKKKLAVRTYVDDVLRYVDIAFTVCLFIIIFSINVATGPNSGFGYFLMLYGFLMLVQGGVMKFKPLLIGAVVNWIGAIGIFINTNFKYDMLITAAAVLIGYIIPGLLLHFQSKKKLNA
ncbi:MAG: hypothetical protein JWQ27_1367 [Ferruginibacter sp.]|nr:hypothetical protein [Ferruginibacter sp.]